MTTTDRGTTSSFQSPIGNAPGTTGVDSGIDSGVDTGIDIGIDIDIEPVEETEKADPLAPIRGHIRIKGFDRVTHGTFLRSVDGEPPDQRRRRELQAWVATLPDGAVLTGLTAAEVLGWQLPKLPELIPVFAAVRGKTAPRRSGLHCSRLRHETTPRVRDGLPLDSAVEILLRCARDLGLLDLKILLDSALRLGDVSAADVDKILDSRRPGVARLRQAHLLSNPKSDSGPESALGLFLHAMQIPAEPQKRLHGETGSLVAQVDYWLIGTNRAVEYDGEHHRKARQHGKDLRRDRLFNGSPYVRDGFTLDDLLNHALTVMHELDRALDRPHDRKRFRYWQRLVSHSMYDEKTRARMLNRWRRQMGVVEWVRPP